MWSSEIIRASPGRVSAPIRRRFVVQKAYFYFGDIELRQFNQIRLCRPRRESRQQLKYRPQTTTYPTKRRQAAMVTANASTAAWDTFQHTATAMTNFFPLFVVGAAALGLIQPAAFSWFGTELLAPSLGVTMLGMGLGLTFQDFQRVLSSPARVFMGFVLQYTIMPFLAFAVSKAFCLPVDLTIGLCLVGCCPGGTASNVVTYLARADVALSVAMTTVSTLGAVVMTPALTQLLLGTLVPVDSIALLLSTVQVVLLPVIAGTALNQAFPEQVSRTAPLAALSAVILIALICGSVMAQSATSVLSAGHRLLGAVVTLHAGGFALGYLCSKALRCPEAVAKTAAIEVGMQNSALGALLSTKHFAGHPLAAAVCAISACTHSVIGSLLAAFWRYRKGGDPLIDRGVPPPPGAFSEAPLEERLADRKSWIAAYRSRSSGASSEASLEARIVDRRAWIAAYKNKV